MHKPTSGLKKEAFDKFAFLVEEILISAPAAPHCKVKHNTASEPHFTISTDLEKTAQQVSLIAVDSEGSGRPPLCTSNLRFNLLNTSSDQVQPSRGEHGLQRQRVVRALLRASVLGTQNGGCEVSLRHRFARSIFSRSIHLVS